jgi:hypothetical protein
MASAKAIKIETFVAVGVAIAMGSIVGVLLVEHGPWGRPSVEPAYSDTATAAKTAGATVAPTDPKTTLKPLQVR